MKTAIIQSVTKKVNWDNITPLIINQYPWYEEGLKQDTHVKLAKTDEALYIRVKAFDVHSSGEILEENGPVYQDSCFEFFFRPEQVINDYYINLEVNCIGTVYLAVQNAKGKRCATPEEIKQIAVRTSLEFGKKKETNEADCMWILDIELSFEWIRNLYGSLNLDVWHGNFYRCGGAIDRQYAVWNPVIALEPDFHQPKQFGRLIFMN